MLVCKFFLQFPFPELRTGAQTALDCAACYNRGEIFEMLVAAGGKCNWKGVRTVRNWKQVSHQEKGFYQTVVDAYFEAKANRRKEPTPDVDAIAAQIRRTLNVPARVAAALASIAFPKKAEMRKW